MRRRTPRRIGSFFLSDMMETINAAEALISQYESSSLERVIASAAFSHHRHSQT